MFENSFTNSELTIEAYHQEKEHTSSTDLKRILVSPAHFAFCGSKPEKDPEHYRMGSALHAATLEPEVFNDRYVVIPKLDMRTTAGKAEYAQFTAENAGRTLVQAEDLDFIKIVRTKIRAHKNAFKLLALPGEAESSIFWQDDETGIKLKVRPDRLLLGGSAYLSVKSTVNAAKDSWRWDIAKYDYDLAEAMYMDGIYQKFGYLPKTIWLLIEKNSWEIQTFSPCQKTLQEGYEKYRKAVHRLKACRDSGVFYGYQPDGEIEEISSPQAIRNQTNPLCA